MYMRIIWGRIAAGQWDGFEAAYKKATSLRGGVKGLKNQWLARDQADPDAGYSITLWESEEAMAASESQADQLRSTVADSAKQKIETVQRFDVPMAFDRAPRLITV